MRSYGALPFSSNFGTDLVRDFVDIDWMTFAIRNGIVWDNDAFHYVNQNHYANWKATLKYDKAYTDPEFSNEFLDQVFTDLKEFFRPWKRSSRILTLSEVTFNPDSAPGYVMKKHFGCSKKINVIQEKRNYVDLFWDKAHIQNYPTLWTQSGKVEMLKRKKIENQDIRSFTIIPCEMFFSLARMSQQTNDIMCQNWDKSPIRHGIVLSFGGILDLVRKMHFPNMKVVEGDCTKWDSTMSPWLLSMCMHLRFYLWDRKGMTEDEWWQRMIYYYQQTIYSCLYNSTGEVLQKFGGQPSGTVNTTDDNCIIHLFVLCAYFRFHLGRSLYSLWRVNVDLALYADDHIMTLSGLKVPLHLLEMRFNHYAKFGLILDREKDFVSSTFEGHTFLGMTLKRVRGSLLPCYDELKAYNSLAKSDGNLTPEQKFAKATSIAYLVCFTPLFDTVYKYCLFLQNTYPSLRIFHNVSRREARAFWLGKETYLGPTSGFKKKQSGSVPLMSKKSKLRKQLAAGKITQQQYDQRLAQYRSAQKARPNNLPKTRPPAKATKMAKQPLREQRPLAPNKSSSSKQVTTGNPTQLPNAAEGYIATLIDPEKFDNKFPDSFTRPTACFRSIAQFDLPVKFETGSNSGRFSFCVQPKFGSYSSLGNYQIAICNPPGPWDTADWSLATNYSTCLKEGDPRVDTNYALLTGGVTSITQWQTGAAAVDPHGYNLFTNGNITLTNGRPITFSNNTAVPNGFNVVGFPIGLWYVDLTFRMVTNATVLPLTTSFKINGISGVTITQQTSFISGPQAVQGDARLVTWSGTVKSSGCLATASIVLERVAGTPILTSDYATYGFYATFTSMASSGGGFIESMRPVAQSALLTYMGPDLLNGGEVSMAYVDPTYIKSAFFGNDNPFGAAQDASVLSKITGGWNDRLATGAYGWWSPRDKNDAEFHSPVEQTKIDYPGIICSGTFTPTSTITAGAANTVLRLRVCTVWEFWTESTAWKTSYGVGSQQIVDTVFAMLRQQTHVRQNGNHLEWIRNFMRQAVTFFRSHPELARNAVTLANQLVALV
jgi:hypothetical protein